MKQCEKVNEGGCHLWTIGGGTILPADGSGEESSFGPEHPGLKWLKELMFGMRGVCCSPGCPSPGPGDLRLQLIMSLSFLKSIIISTALWALSSKLLFSLTHLYQRWSQLESCHLQPLTVWKTDVQLLRYGEHNSWERTQPWGILCWWSRSLRHDEEVHDSPVVLVLSKGY